MKSKQFGILGLGHFGESVAINLTQLGADVIVVDNNEDKIQNIANDVAYAVQADVTDLNALKSIGLKNVDAAVISLTTDINASLMAVLNCQDLGIKIIYSKANSPQHQKVLEHLGVTRVLNPENEMGKITATELFGGDFLHQIALSKDYSIMEVNTLKAWYNKTLNQLDLRKFFGITVVAIVNGEKLNIAPSANDKILPGSKIIVLGENSAISHLEQLGGE